MAKSSETAGQTSKARRSATTRASAQADELPPEAANPTDGDTTSTSVTDVEEVAFTEEPSEPVRVRRRTTRTIRRTGETYSSESEEVVEDYAAPALMEHTAHEHPLPVG